MRFMLYLSEGRAAEFRADHAAIIALARRNNPELGITGLLVTSGTTYVQMLEGPGETLVPLVRYIAGDRRHSGFRLLMEREITNRAFAGWSMAQCAAHSVSPAIETAIAAARAATNPGDPAIRALAQAMLGLSVPLRHTG